MTYATLTIRQRINRILLGSILILFTLLLTSSPLGVFALLPLVATYPLFAGIYGYDPLANFTRYQFGIFRRAAGRLADVAHDSRHA